MKTYWGENICLPHAQTAIFDSKVKLFLKVTGYEYDGNIFVAWVLLWGVLSCCLTPSILFNFRYKKIKTYMANFIYICWRGPTTVVHRNENVLKSIFKRGYETSLCLNIICNRSYFILKWCQLSSGPTFTQGWKHIGAKTYLFTACANCYLRLPAWDRV
jgi:hypothetical protein